MVDQPYGSSLDLAAWGCCMPMEEPPRTRTATRRRAAQRIAAAREAFADMPTSPTPMDLPAPVVRLESRPERVRTLRELLPLNVLRVLLQWRSVLTLCACCALLLHLHGVDSAVVVPLLCMAVSTVVCSQQAAADAGNASEQPATGGSGDGSGSSGGGGGSWYAGSSRFLGTSTLVRFGRAAFYCGAPGSPSRSPPMLPVAPRSGSPPVLASATPTASSPASSPAASPTAAPAAPPGGSGDAPPSAVSAAEAAVVQTLHRHESVDVSNVSLVVAPTAVQEALQSVLARAEAHQWLDAGLALRALDAAVHAAPRDPHVLALQKELRTRPAAAAAVQTVRSRYAECVEALRVLSAGEEVWQFAQSFRGVTSHYKHDAAGRLWLRTEGVMEDVSMIECVALWKEIDLFSQWFPLCSESSVLAQQGRVELLAWMQLAAPGLPIGKRDAVLHGYGVDALDDGFMLVIGRSAQQADFPSVAFPPVTGFGSARMHVQGLQVLVTPLAERRVRCSYVVHIDMRAPLPAPMLQFATQRVVGMIFHKLQKEARRIRLGSAESPHAARMERERHVYFGWMLPRMKEALLALGLAPAPRASPASEMRDVSSSVPRMAPALSGEIGEPEKVPPTPTTLMALRRDALDHQRLRAMTATGSAGSDGIKRAVVRYGPDSPAVSLSSSTRPSRSRPAAARSRLSLSP